MNRLGHAVRAAIAAAVFVLPVAAAIAPTGGPATVPVMDPAAAAVASSCCTGTPWGEIGEPPV